MLLTLQAILIIAISILIIVFGVGVVIMSAASDRAVASQNALSASIDAAVAKLSTPPDTTATDAIFTSLADQADADKAKLDAANPPA